MKTVEKAWSCSSETSISSASSGSSSDSGSSAPGGIAHPKGRRVTVETKDYLCYAGSIAALLFGAYWYLDKHKSENILWDLVPCAGGSGVAVAVLAGFLMFDDPQHTRGRSAGPVSRTAVKIPGYFWTLSILAANSTYFVGSELLSFPAYAESCIWNLCLILSVCCYVHIAAALRKPFGCLAYVVLLALAICLPAVSEGRRPFSLQVRECPSWMHVTWASVGMVSGLFAAFLPDVTIIFTKEQRRGGLAGSSTDGLHLWFEFVPLACALCRITQLTMSGYWKFHDDGQKPTPVLNSVYHIVWSWMRTIMPLYFAGYWLNRYPRFMWIQALMCGTGFCFWFLFSPLANSHRKAEVPDLCEYRPPDYQRHWPQPIEWPYGMQMVCFFLMQFCFVLHGLLSGSWSDIHHGRCFRDSVSFAMLVVFGAVLGANMATSVGQDLPNFYVWLCDHMFFGYVTMAVAMVYALWCMPRQLVTLQVGHAALLS